MSYYASFHQAISDTYDAMKPAAEALLKSTVKEYRHQHQPVRSASMVRSALMDTPREQSELFRPGLREMPPAEPSLSEIIEKAKQATPSEAYYIFRNRDASRVEGDRLLDAIAKAEDMDDACEKLKRIAGYDTMEAEVLGLDAFNAGNIMELCDRLHELTGDRYEVSPFETPLDA